MPSYPPPRRLRTDNIKRWLARATAERLAVMLGAVGGKSGPWPENDPEAYAAYVNALLHDPRLQRTRAEHIPADHPDAALRLDRCVATRLTVTCNNCHASAVYAVEDLRRAFRADQNIMALPPYLLPCPSKRERREGACHLRAEPGGYPDNLRTVESARKAVS
jgi:hypothetical protein